MIGTGNLGRALLGYKGFGNQNFRIVAAFDIDPTKVGGAIDGVDVHHFDELAEVIARRQIKLAMIVVLAPAAQAVADKLVAAGIEGIVNFCPGDASSCRKASTKSARRSGDRVGAAQLRGRQPPETGPGGRRFVSVLTEPPRC